MIVKIDQSAHWYQKDGTPCYEVPRAKGDGMRATTLRDARKLDLLPSVTTILQVLRNPVLEAWKLEQAVLAALTLPRPEEESLDAFAKRVAEDMDQTRSAAATLGSETHAAIEEWHKNEKMPVREDLVCFVKVYANWAKQNIKEVINVERVFSSLLGYGGKIDLVYLSIDDDLCIVDWKTQGTKKNQKVRGYESWGLQLAAYAYGLPVDDIRKTRLLNVVLSTTEPGRIDVVDWTDKAQELWEAFTNLFQVWKWSRSYFCGPDLRTVTADRVREPDTAEQAPDNGSPVAWQGQIAGRRELQSAEWAYNIHFQPQSAPPMEMGVGSMVALAPIDVRPSIDKE